MMPHSEWRLSIEDCPKTRSCETVRKVPTQYISVNRKTKKETNKDTLEVPMQQIVAQERKYWNFIIQLRVLYVMIHWPAIHLGNPPISHAILSMQSCRITPMSHDSALRYLDAIIMRASRGVR